MRFGRSMAMIGMAMGAALGMGMSPAAAASPPPRNPHDDQSRPGGVSYGGYRLRRWSKYKRAHSSEGERQRRLRQIERGKLGASFINGAGASLRVENGLVQS